MVSDGAAAARLLFHRMSSNQSEGAQRKLEAVALVEHFAQNLSGEQLRLFVSDARRMLGKELDKNLVGEILLPACPKVLQLLQDIGKSVSGPAEAAQLLLEFIENNSGSGMGSKEVQSADQERQKREAIAFTKILVTELPVEDLATFAREAEEKLKANGLRRVFWAPVVPGVAEAFELAAEKTDGAIQGAQLLYELVRFNHKQHFGNVQAQTERAKSFVRKQAPRLSTDQALLFVREARKKFESWDRSFVKGALAPAASIFQERMPVEAKNLLDGSEAAEWLVEYTRNFYDYRMGDAGAHREATKALAEALTEKLSLEEMQAFLNGAQKGFKPSWSAGFVREVLTPVVLKTNRYLVDAAKDVRDGKEAADRLAQFTKSNYAFGLGNAASRIQASRTLAEALTEKLSLEETRIFLNEVQGDFKSSWTSDLVREVMTPVGLKAYQRFLSEAEKVSGGKEAAEWLFDFARSNDKLRIGDWQTEQRERARSLVEALAKNLNLEQTQAFKREAQEKFNSWRSSFVDQVLAPLGERERELHRLAAGEVRKGAVAALLLVGYVNSIGGGSEKRARGASELTQVFARNLSLHQLRIFVNDARRKLRAAGIDGSVVEKVLGAALKGLS